MLPPNLHAIPEPVSPSSPCFSRGTVFRSDEALSEACAEGDFGPWERGEAQVFMMPFERGSDGADVNNAPAASIVCACCGHQGHGVADCAWPRQSGCIEGCPICNQDHYLLDCSIFARLTLFGQAEEIIKNGAGKPPIKLDHDGLTWVEWFSQQWRQHERLRRNFSSDKWPWTRLFAVFVREHPAAEARLRQYGASLDPADLPTEGMVESWQGLLEMLALRN